MGTALALMLCAAASSQAPLPKAEKLIDDLQYAAALPELDAALKVPGNSREQLIRINWLKGMVLALLNKPDGARTPLRLVATLAPEFKPDEGQPTRVMTAWFEAKGWASSQGAFSFVRTAALEVKLENDVLKLSRTLRFHVREDGGVWRLASSKLPGRMALDFPNATRIEWWAELLGDRDAVLASAGSESSPFTEAGLKPAVAAAPVAVAPAAVSPEPAVIASSGSRSSLELTRPLQLAGYSGVALAAIGFAIGGYFGAVSKDELTRYNQAMRASDGAISSFTQRDAQALTDSQRTHATLATSLFVTASLLAAVGLVAWILGLSA